MTLLCGIIIICIVALIASPLIIITGAGYLIWKAVAKRMLKKSKYCSGCKYHEAVYMDASTTSFCIHLCHFPTIQEAWLNRCPKSNKYNTCKYFEQSIPF